mgnify:FL=1
MNIKSLIAQLSLIAVACSAYSQDSYDYVWSGTSTGDFKWTTSSNWSPNGVPSSGDSVYITSTAENGLGANNLDLGGDVYVGDVTWVLASETQKLYTGGTLNAENFTVDFGLAGWPQFCVGSSLNVSKSDGTGKLLIHNSSKHSHLGAQFIVNAAITSDNIELAAVNAWADGSYINISIGWNGGGSAEKPIIKVLNEFSVAQGSSLTSGSATTYVSLGGVSGAGTFKPGDKKLYVTLTGSGSYEFSGVSSVTDGGGIFVTSASSGVQKFVNSGFNLAGVNMQSGRLEIAGSAGDVALSGGTISSIENGSGGDVLMMDSLTWSGGKIALDLDGEYADTVSISGNFSTTGSGKLVFDLNFDEIAMRDLIEGSEDKKYTYDLISVGGTSDIANTNFVFEDDYGTFSYDFENGMLTISLNPIPEPAAIAAILGAIALGVAARRRRK